VRAGSTPLTYHRPGWQKLCPCGSTCMAGTFPAAGLALPARSSPPPPSTARSLRRPFENHATVATRRPRGARPTTTLLSSPPASPVRHHQCPQSSSLPARVVVGLYPSASRPAARRRTARILSALTCRRRCGACLACAGARVQRDHGAFATVSLFVIVVVYPSCHRFPVPRAPRGSIWKFSYLSIYFILSSNEA
jgi:hypothetical protein